MNTIQRNTDSLENRLIDDSGQGYTTHGSLVAYGAIYVKNRVVGFVRENIPRAYKRAEELLKAMGEYYRGD